MTDIAYIETSAFKATNVDKAFTSMIHGKILLRNNFIC